MPNLKNAESYVDTLRASAIIQRPVFSQEHLRVALKIILHKGNSQGLCDALWSLSAMGLITSKSFTCLAEKLVEMELDYNVRGTREVAMVRF